MKVQHRRPAEWRWDVVRSVNYYQQIVRRLPSADRWAYSLMEDMGYPRKQALACLEDADTEGLIEYGVSLRAAWLTDAGRRMLLEGRP